MSFKLYNVRNTAGRIIGKVLGTSECDAYWAARAEYGSKAADVTEAR